MTPNEVSGNYLGDRGREYLAYVEPLSGPVAALNVRHFEPAVRGKEVVIDFGCGSGHLLQQLGAPRVIGIEVNESARALASDRGVEVVASADELEDEVADVIVSSHALEHSRDPLKELASLRRLLKEDGRLVMILPLDDWRVQRRLDSDVNHHLFAWTPLSLRNLFTEAGYSVEDVEVVTRAAPTRFGLWRLPRPLLDVAEVTWAVVRRRRQLLITATRG